MPSKSTNPFACIRCQGIAFAIKGRERCEGGYIEQVTCLKCKEPTTRTVRELPYGVKEAECES